MTQLGAQDKIHLKVKISEEILHSAVMHLFANRFFQICEKEEKDDPDIEKVPYCLHKKVELDRKESKNSDKKYFKEGLERRYGRYNYMSPKRSGRPSTPPSVLKRQLRLEPRDIERRFKKISKDKPSSSCRSY